MKYCITTEVNTKNQAPISKKDDFFWKLVFGCWFLPDGYYSRYCGYKKQPRRWRCFWCTLYLASLDSAPALVKIINRDNLCFSSLGAVGIENPSLK
jgi:hypothetical protein